MATAADASNNVITDDEFYQMKEENRLKTFRNWGFDGHGKSKCTSKKLAEAGFVHVTGDCVKCVVCFKELEGWEAEDDPWKEHKKHTIDAGRKCEFVKIGKKQSELTVEEFLRLCKTRHRNLMQLKGENQIKEFEQKAEEVRRRLQNL